jgi:uncharacterized protein YfkK (UPF0435 family)
MSEIQDTVPELYFLKYKGVPSPWEIISQAKRLGFKCKKYANWSEVHATSDSRQTLKAVGDSLIDSEEFDIAYYPELSQIWEKVQRWAKDKDGFSLEPDLLPEYEKLARLVDVGSKTPNVVDLMINEFGFKCDSIDINDRWLVFLSICTYNFFQSKKRYEYALNLVQSLEVNKSKPEAFIDSVGGLLTALYLIAGFDTSTFSGKEVIPYFIGELGLASEPHIIERDSSVKVSSLPKIWVERYEGTQLELVKFEYSDGDIFVRVNKANRVFSKDSQLGQLLSSEAYWSLVGKTIETNISQIDEIQDFYNTFARHLRAET